MPPSGIDVPRVIDAVDQLYRTIKTPPSADWTAPDLLRERWKRIPSAEVPGPASNPEWWQDPLGAHARLIDETALELLERLQSDGRDVTAIRRSLLAEKEKRTLSRLAKRLSRIRDSGAWILSEDEKWEHLAFLESALNDLTGTPPADSPATTIWFHQERQYSLDRQTPLKVSEECDSILQAFLESQAAMETSDIEQKAGVTNPSRAMKNLAEWNNGIFKDAIRIPKEKAKGGYFVRVQRL